MKADSIVFTIAGMCFGVILGWVLGTQQAGRLGVPAAAPAPAQAATAAGASGAPRATLDEARVQSLTTILTSDPSNAGAALQLANTYFDGERYDDAVTWYEKALKLNPKDPDASTDLGVSYYYLNQADRALQQFDYSLKINPTHTKTLLNQGIVLAFGKQDLVGASAAWKKVVDIAPESPEGQAAKRALEGVAAAHQNGAVTPGAAAPRAPGG
jgi:tetratricopeptide (TPR) repeat protein